MQFFNSSKIEDFVDQEVLVAITSNTQNIETITGKAFLLENKLFIDVIPQLNRKYVVEVPDSSVFSFNEMMVTIPRCGIVIQRETNAGQFILNIIEQKRHLQNMN